MDRAGRLSQLHAGLRHRALLPQPGLDAVVHILQEPEDGARRDPGWQFKIYQNLPKKGQKEFSKRAYV